MKNTRVSRVFSYLQLTKPHLLRVRPAPVHLSATRSQAEPAMCIHGTRATVVVTMYPFVLEKLPERLTTLEPFADPNSNVPVDDIVKSPVTVNVRALLLLLKVTLPEEQLKLPAMLQAPAKVPVLDPL